MSELKVLSRDFSTTLPVLAKTIKAEVNRMSSLLLNLTNPDTIVSRIRDTRSEAKNRPIMLAISWVWKPKLPSISGIIEMKAMSPVKAKANPTLMFKYFKSLSNDRSMDFKKDRLQV